MRGLDVFRQYLRAVTLTFTLLLLSPAALWAQWSQYQGNAAHTGYAVGMANTSGVTKKWEKSYTWQGSPALSRDGIAVGQQGVFVMVYTGYGSNGNYYYYDLVSLNLASAEEQWRSKISSYAGNVSAPSLDGSSVYVHSFGHSGTGGITEKYPYLMGVDANTGAVMFKTTHAGQWSSGSRPTVLGGQVVALGGYYGGMDSYDAITGQNQWFTKLPQQYHFIPAMDEHLVYIYYGAASASPGPSISTLYAINRTTGVIEYTIQNPSDIFTTYSSLSSVMLGDQSDAIVIGNTNYNGPKLLTSFDLAQHGIRWTRGLDAVNALAVADGFIAVPLSGSLKMINEATGLDLWTWVAPSGVSLNSNVVLTDNMVFVASGDTLFGIERATGQQKWSEFIGSDNGARYNLAYYDGTLYASGSSRILAYDTVPKPLINVVIDIKPNNINLHGKNGIRVAILTTNNFDASTVDPSTVVFAGAIPLRWALQDADKDGYVDMVLQFDQRELTLTPSSTSATLTGATRDGQPIEGTDSVRIVPPDR